MLAGLAVTSTSGRVEPFRFRFSTGTFGDDVIFESATSTPSRYLIEIGRRLRRAAPVADDFVIGNPLLPLSPPQLAEWAGHGSKSPSIVTDAGGFPILYVLPRRLFEEGERLLLPLSTVHSELDARLLSVLAGVEVSRKKVDIARLDAFPAMSANGWMNPDNRLRALKRQAENAIEIIEARADWRDLPFAAFHPYHAGDALFVGLASSQAAPLLYDQQIVCSAFKEVVEAANPRIRPVELSMEPMARDGSVSKYRYFVNALGTLGNGFTGSTYVIFARLLRMHHCTPFHLIDHAKFTLGDPMDALERTIYGQPPATATLCELPPKPLRILFHLNGGWPLKTYPLDRTRVLFQVLTGMGCELTVIDRPDLEGAGVRSVPGGNLTVLKPLVEAHHLFVGVDSFPLHYARLVMGRPTIALFGSTKPCNHDAPYGRDYRAMVNHLPCNSCLAKTGCPMLGGGDCTNYAMPEAVVSEIVEMGYERYGFCMA